MGIQFIWIQLKLVFKIDNRGAETQFQNMQIYLILYIRSNDSACEWGVYHPNYNLWLEFS